jgi:6-phosphogluconolactonase
MLKRHPSRAILSREILRMRHLPAALGALAIVLAGCRGGETTVPFARAPFVLIVPYFTIVGDIRGSNSVSVYKIDATTGALTRAAGSPLTAGKDPTAEALALGGRFAYVVNKGSNNVSAYKVNVTTGSLTPVAGSPFAIDYSSSGPNAVTVDPAGKHAYIVSDAGVSGFSINAATGALAPVPGSPFAAVSLDGFGTASIAVDPSGRFAYVLNYFRNTVSAYTINTIGALKLAGSPLDAGQNSNDMASFNSVTVDPKGKFAYVTGSCCVYVYAIDAATGALAPRAHLSLSRPGDVDLKGFAVDPSGKFAYALNGGRVNAYTIDAATGLLKAAAGRTFSVRTGADPYGITIDPSDTFVYVSDSGTRVSAPTISAYSIDPSTGELTPLARSPFTVSDNRTDPIARWFSAGTCAAFNGALWSDAHPPPFATRDSEGVILDRVTVAARGYFYDPKNHFALRYPNFDSGGTFTLRVSGPPPPGVPRRDLSKLHTESGIKLGSSAGTVVSLLGRPKIINGCDLQRYVYLTNRVGEPTSLQFTISRGRVTEIFEDFGG